MTDSHWSPPTTVLWFRDSRQIHLHSFQIDSPQTHGLIQFSAWPDPLVSALVTDLKSYLLWGNSQDHCTPSDLPPIPALLIFSIPPPILVSCLCYPWRVRLMLVFSQTFYTRTAKVKSVFHSRVAVYTCLSLTFPSVPVPWVSHQSDMMLPRRSVADFDKKVPARGETLLY